MKRARARDDGAHKQRTKAPLQVRWASALGTQLVDAALRREALKRQREVMRRTEDYPCQQAETVKSGRARLEDFDAAFRYLFATTDIRLGYMQKKMVDSSTIALLPKFFKTDLVANLKWLRKKYVIKELNDTWAFSYPRRAGKTEAAAMLYAVLAVSQPGGNCVMFNLTQTHAKEFLNSVIKYLQKFEDSPEFGWKEDRRDLNRFIDIVARKTGTINSIRSLGGGQKGDAKIGSRFGNRTGVVLQQQQALHCTLIFFIHSVHAKKGHIYPSRSMSWRDQPNPCGWAWSAISLVIFNFLKCSRLKPSSTRSVMP